MAFFSIINPSYKRAHIIKKAIDSVLAQSLSDFELIILDDASTVNTECVVSALNDSGIQYIKQENKGVCAARNTRLRNATGTYITFLDSYNHFLINWLEDFYTIIDNKNPDLVFCDMQLTERNQKIKLVSS